MPLTKDELKEVSQHFTNAASHYKQIGRMLAKADQQIKFFEGTGHPMTADQITDLKATLVDLKTKGDDEIAAAEALIAS